MSLNEYQFGWNKRFHDEYGNEQRKQDYPLHIRWHHTEGPSGMGPQTPSGRDYGAVVEEVSDSVTRWKPVPGREDPKFGYNYSQLAHVKEYGNLENIANSVVDATDFMEKTGADTVNFENDSNAAALGVEEHDLVKNLYEKRPKFPRRFATPERAKQVAEILIKRRDQGLPITPRPKRK